MLRTGGLRLFRAHSLNNYASLSFHKSAAPVQQLQQNAIIDDEVAAARRGHSISHSDEYTAEPHYPPIQELTFRAKQLRKRTGWYDHIQSLPTVEEKLLELNMPRYYGYKCLMLSDDRFPYDCLPLVQHSTRTVISDNGLPALYDGLRAQAASFVDTIRDDVQAAVAFEAIGYRPEVPDDDEQTATERLRSHSARIVAQVHRVVTNALQADAAHLRHIETDSDPRHEAFWFVGGIAPPTKTRAIRKGCSWQKDIADQPVDRQFQYVGRPLLTVRHALPLRPLQDSCSSSEVSAANQPPPPPPPTSHVPSFTHDPRTLGFAHEHRHGVTVPGFWPGAEHEFGTLAYLSSAHLAGRNPAYGEADNRSAVHAQAILGSFGWLLGQACYQGFSNFSDPTYALSTQTIITDGQQWSFYAYQLNTTQTHQDALVAASEGELAPRVNRCWTTGEQRLYERVEPDGTIVGWNDEVLRNLVLFYLNEPAARGHEMRPYLSREQQRAAQIEDAERRQWVESRFKHAVSNRPRHRLVPEVYQWEKIYKIDNETLPLAPKRRFFELRVNPFERRMDEHSPPYVPKVLRPSGPKCRAERWEKTFYPSRKN